MHIHSERFVGGVVRGLEVRRYRLGVDGVRRARVHKNLCFCTFLQIPVHTHLLTCVPYVFYFYSFDHGFKINNKFIFVATWPY